MLRLGFPCVETGGACNETGVARFEAGGARVKARAARVETGIARVEVRAARVESWLIQPKWSIGVKSLSYEIWCLKTPLAHSARNRKNQ